MQKTTVLRRGRAKRRPERSSIENANTPVRCAPPAAGCAGRPGASRSLLDLERAPLRACTTVWATKRNQVGLDRRNEPRLVDGAPRRRGDDGVRHDSADLARVESPRGRRNGRARLLVVEDV